MIVYFDYVLHDSHTAPERIAAISEGAGIEIDDELAAKIGRPFQRVALACSLDTKTGSVTIQHIVAEPEQ